MTVLLVNPVGNFPLNDDWAYAWTVKRLLESGELHLSDWTAVNLLSQALWGALFCLPFGFSFTALRISTLVLGLVGVLATYGILREAKANPAVALLGSLVVALNPLYLAMANSFNTDVPAFALSVASLYLLLRGLRLESWVHVGLGILLSLISVMSRQSGVVVLVAFGLAILVKRGLSARNVALAVAPTIAALLLNFGYAEWLSHRGELPLLYGLQISELLNTLSAGIPRAVSVYAPNLAIMAVYFGLFLFPFLTLGFWMLCTNLPSGRRWFGWATGVLALSAGLVLILKRGPMPYIGNVLDTFGIGPFSLYGSESFLGLRDEELLRGFWTGLTVLGAAGGVVLLVLLASAAISAVREQREHDQDRPWALTFHLAVVAAYLSAIAGLDGSWFDRYLILPLPMLMAAAVLGVKARPGLRLNARIATLSWAWLLLAGGLGVAATHDYLSWNRARWQATDVLMEQRGITPAQIDGGFEFNGWFFGHRVETCNPTRPDRRVPGWRDFTCLFNASRDPNRLYTLAFVPRDGYDVVGQVSFSRWLPRVRQELYVLRKPTGAYR